MAIIDPRSDSGQPVLEPGLYVVATPIGNLSDISRRAESVLREAAVIAAEDTRHTATLLRHLGLGTPLTAYHEHSAEGATAAIIARLNAGEVVALVSDAGTPLVSDPGYRLVRAAQDAGHRVIAVPGACAAVAALSAAGVPSDRFLFCGFLPARGAARRAALEALRGERPTLVFYEAPHRLRESLDDMCSVFGAQREAVIARELTKRFETVRRAPLAELSRWVAADADQRRGEVVVLVRGAAPAAQGGDVDPALLQLLRSMAEAMPARRAAAMLARYTGLRKNTLYRAYLDAEDPA